MNWQPIETAPRDGTGHVRGLWVHSAKTGKPIYWEAIAGYVNDDCEFVDHDSNAPWRADDYTHWMPLPAPPCATWKGASDGEATANRTRQGSGSVRKGADHERGISRLHPGRGMGQRAALHSLAPMGTGIGTAGNPRAGPPMTASTPEAVERLARHTEKACKCEFDGIDVSAALRALSAERDALKAELAEAVGVLQYVADEDDDVIYCDEAATALTRAATKSRAIIAHHQKETGT